MQQKEKAPKGFLLADGTVLKGRGHSAAGHGVDPFQIPLQQVLPVHGNKQIPHQLRLRLRGVLGDLSPGKGVIQGLLVLNQPTQA